MIIAKNEEKIPDNFTRCGDGFANQVYKDEKQNLVLKIYSKKSYYEAELSAFSSGFDKMPRLLESGTIGNKCYVVMTLIGSEVSSLHGKHIVLLAKTLARLHGHKQKKQEPELYKKFDWLFEHDALIQQAREGWIRGFRTVLMPYI